ncbi:hypothetical protein [Shimia sp.]|uniref:hypothetical protein n=1 Tax=Shimia sp. TaxID=1954381 RepID=UPI003B8B794F
MLTISDSIQSFERSLSDVAQRQLPFATAMALNDTAADVDEAWTKQMARRLDRPTPFTMRGIRRQRAVKRRLVATVAFKDIQAQYLRLQVEGGSRKPVGNAILIPVAQKLNRYGNMPKGAVGRSVKRKDTFIASRGDKKTAHLRPGIYKRPKRGAYMKNRSRKSAGQQYGYGNKNRGKHKGPQLLVAFQDRASYRARLDLQSVAERRARQSMPLHFKKRFIAAMATAH